MAADPSKNGNSRNGRTPPQGRRWQPGQSGNPGGRPKGLAAATRKLLQESAEHMQGDMAPQNGEELLVRFWINILADREAEMKHRLEASKLLAERGYGRAPEFAPIADGDPLGMTEEEKTALANEFDSVVVRLADASKPRASS